MPADEADDFPEVVRAHADIVFGFVLRRVGDRALAEDLTQETFFRAWRGRAKLRDEGSMRGWLCTIAANVVRDHARRVRRRPVEVAEPEHFDIPQGGDLAEHVVMAESVEQLRSALAALPARQREIFLLRERDGLTYQEIATVLDCPIGTVMSGLSRARERLLKAVRA